MEYKKHYTDEELAEVVNWFKEHFDELPQSIHIDKATYIADLKHTVTLYYDIVAKHKDNPTYAAYTHKPNEQTACSIILQAVCSFIYHAPISAPEGCTNA